MVENHIFFETGKQRNINHSIQYNTNNKNINIALAAAQLKIWVWKK